MFLGRTTTTLSSTVLVAYPVHACLMKISAIVCLWVIKNSLTLVAFLPVAMERSKDSDTLGAGANRSAVHIFTVTDEVEAKKAGNSLVMKLCKK